MTSDILDLWRRQAVFASGVAAMGPFAGFVMATRMAQMASEAGRPTASGAAEMQRMMTEKVSAVVEGGMAATRVMTGAATATSPIALAGLMISAGEAAIRPAARTVRANARRLSRKTA
jgi:hypothetical protein